ncbi:MAG: carbohydrate kinase family protein [Anaerolineales bacterium]
MFDILVAGEINPDLILSGNVIPEFDQVEKMVDSARLTVGSSSAIFACGAVRLGLNVGFIGNCGDDVFGRFMLDKMQTRRVDISNVIIHPNRQTGLSVILNRENDRAILTFPGLIASLKAEAVSDHLLHQTRHLHIASYFLQTALHPGLPDLFRRAKLAGVTTSLDTNWDPTGEWHGLEELLQLTDVFLPNENEAIAISGATSLENALKVLSQKCKAVAIKCGSRGALAGQGNKTSFAPALSVQIVDTVGAGDSFDAGFVYGWLNDWVLDEALMLATACGSLSTQAAGGTSAQPTLDEAMRYVTSTG